MLRITSARLSLVSRGSPRSALTVYRAFSYPSTDAEEDGASASSSVSSHQQSLYTPTQKHVMDKCKEMHASIMPLNEKVGNSKIFEKILYSVSLSDANPHITGLQYSFFLTRC
jgi:hypothetical protein